MSRKSKASLVLGLAMTAALTLGPLPANARPAEVNAHAASPAAFPAAVKNLPRDPSRPSVLVNKEYPLAPLRYTPKTVSMKDTGIRLHPAADEAYRKLASAASKSGVKIKLTSGYRSYNRQAELYDHYSRIYGPAYAQRVAARPGTSEHQTGFAIDVGNYSRACALQACFEDTKVGRWMAKNAPKYGFILRYPKGQESVTGYTYEPWHFRYVGTKLARSYTSSGAKTLEHYYGAVPKAPKVRGSAYTTVNLNLRTGPSTGDRILLTIPKGKKVGLTGKKSSGWYQVRYASTTGWVSGTYLRNISSSENSPEQPSKGTKHTTVNLNLRTGPSTQHRVLLTIPKGKAVHVTGSAKSGWHPVRYNSTKGWVSGQYLR